MHGVLEDASERAPVRRLGRLPLRLQAGDELLDLVGLARLETELHACDDLAVSQVGVPVAEAELGGRAPRHPIGVDDQRALEDPGPVAAARSTSPAPIVTTRSPGRATVATNATPSSTVGVHATVIPGRMSARPSTTSLPVTFSSGASRAA